MTDGRLREELERRSKSAALGHDWARRELLPVISAAIDTRPQPVTTPRAPAFAGLAAAVAILLVLVVALPRLTPSPPVANERSSSPAAAAAPSAPNVSPPELLHPQVMAAQEFAVEVLTGRLRSSTVLVDGTIASRAYRDGPICLRQPDQLCLMGRLEDTDPSVDVHSRWHAAEEQDTSVIGGELPWPWWHLPSGPITGTLVLSVDSEGSIEFVGRVDPTSDRDHPLNVAEAFQIDVDSVAIDDVVLVEGWLNETEPPGSTISIDCIMPPADDQIPGLPSRYCQPTDTLTSAWGGRWNGGGQAAALQVQVAAAEQFGRRSLSSRGLFAISPRLYGGCFPGPSPCWEWDIVGRLSETPLVPQTTLQPGTRLLCGPTQPPDPHANQPSAIWTGFALDDQTGFVERCEAWEFQPADASRMTVTNPNGDSRVVELTWAEACASYANVAFNGLLSGFEIVPTSTMPDNSTCDGVVYSRGLRLYLTQPVAAETVSTRVIYTPAVTPRPTPPATPQIAPGSGWWELAAAERPTGASSELDLLVYERECANGESPEGRVVGPDIEYGDASVTITFQVSPLPGAGDCPAAPGAPVTVQLSEPLGDRRLVDGGFASSDRVIQHSDGLLWVTPLRSLERATARFAALLGADACPQTVTDPRALDEADLEQLANELGTPNGMLGDGLAWVGSVDAAVPELGGFELYQDRDRAWYMIGFAEEQAWLADGIEPGDLVLADVTSLPISGGRTIWIVGRYHQTFGSPDCAWDSDATSALGPRADQQDLGFTVSIAAPSASWTAGQSPEGFGATLEYSGPQDPIVIVGSGSGIAFAYWTRLDGDPSTPPLAVTADCKGYQMASGDSQTVPMYPAPGFSHNGTLTLQPGLWRLTTFASFTIEECGGQEVGLSASIIVRVR